MMTSLEDFFPVNWVPVFWPVESRGGDSLVGHEVPYLDHGYVQLVDVMGDDMTVADGARTSYRSSADNYTDEQNKGLIRYLVENRHTSPLELPAISFRVKVPLFVRAQHVRHRTQSCNWESHRYQEPTGEFYVPPVSRLRYQDGWNKQGSGQRLPENVAQELREACVTRGETAWADYKHLVGEVGLSRESARDVITPNFYCTGVFTMKLHNLLHYLNLRNDEHSQPEIRLLAHTMEEYTKLLFPMTYEAWKEFDKDSVNLSRTEYESVLYTNNRLDMGHVAEDIDGLHKSTRRQKDFIKKMYPKMKESEIAKNILGGKVLGIGEENGE